MPIAGEKPNMRDNDTLQVRRRKVLQTVGTSAAVGAVGFSAFTGTAAAWERQTVEFKDCSEVRIVVDPQDINHDPPAVVRVVVASPYGVAVCRDVEFTQENTTRIPGEYGDAPVRKVTVGDREKLVGVVFYNRDPEGRFASASCIVTNDHQCALIPNTPSVEDATCVQEAKETGGYDCEDSVTLGTVEIQNQPSRDEETDDGGRGPPTGPRNNDLPPLVTDFWRTLYQRLNIF